MAGLGTFPLFYYIKKRKKINASTFNAYHFKASRDITANLTLVLEHLTSKKMNHQKLVGMTNLNLCPYLKLSLTYYCTP